MPNHQPCPHRRRLRRGLPVVLYRQASAEKAIELSPDIPVEVHWRPYFLNDWIPREGISREQYLTTKFGSPERYKGIAQRVAAAASAKG